jgi:hypothetical protein
VVAARAAATTLRHRCWRTDPPASRARPSRPRDGWGDPEVEHPLLIIGQQSVRFLHEQPSLGLVTRGADVTNDPAPARNRLSDLHRGGPEAVRTLRTQATGRSYRRELVPWRRTNETHRRRSERSSPRKSVHVTQLRFNARQHARVVSSARGAATSGSGSVNTFLAPEDSGQRQVRLRQISRTGRSKQGASTKTTSRRPCDCGLPRRTTCSRSVPAATRPGP